MLSTDPSKQAVVKKFLYESYSLAKESVRRRRADRLREDRERKVRSSELDRQALEMVPDGIICVDRTGLLYLREPRCGINVEREPVVAGASVWRGIA